MNERRRNPRALIAGWFSFDDGHATAGDLLAADTVKSWLAEAGVEFDVAAVAPFSGTVDWRKAAPDLYDTVIFVCGPFEQKPYEAEFISRFRDCRLVGMNLTMDQSPTVWNPFDLLLERDSPTTGRADLVFGQQRRSVPVCGVCLVEDYPGGSTETAHAAIDKLLAGTNAATIPVDTRLDTNQYGLRSEAEIESVIAALDVMVTTRLHGMVLAIKNGVPVLPIDPRPGGGKIVQQAATIGWPIAFEVASLDSHDLEAAFNFCLTEQARERAAASAAEAAVLLDEVRDSFLAAVVDDVWDVDAAAVRTHRRVLNDLVGESDRAAGAGRIHQLMRYARGNR